MSCVLQSHQEEAVRDSSMTDWALPPPSALGLDPQLRSTSIDMTFYPEGTAELSTSSGGAQALADALLVRRRLFGGG